MLEYQIKRLFIKFGAFVLVSLAVIAASKFFAVKYAYEDNLLSDEATVVYDQLCEDTAGMKPKEKTAYIANWSGRYNNEYMKKEDHTEKEESEYRAKEDARNAYQNHLMNNIYTLEGVKRYIKTGSGFVSAGYPTDLNEHSQAYADLPTPESINSIYVIRFLTLQNFNICPVIVILLVGLFIADTYEKRLDLTIKISAQSIDFYRTREIVLCIFIFVLNVFNFISDLCISKLIFHTRYLSAPLQSVTDLVFCPAEVTVGGAVGILFALELMAAFVSYEIFILIAQKIRSARNYLIAAAAVTAVFSIIPIYFSQANIWCFIGFNKKMQVLSQLKYIKGMGSTTFFISFVVYAACLGGLTAWRFYGYRESKNVGK